MDSNDEPVGEVVENHVHGEGCIGHCAPNIYDGVLVFQCSDGQVRNAWRAAIEDDPGNPVLQRRYQAGQMIADAIAEGAMENPTPRGRMG